LIRTQIQLTEAQSARLHEAARRSGISAAEVIRQSLDLFLDQETAPAAAGKGRWTALEVSGRFRSGLSDIATRHDDYLEEVYSSTTTPGVTP
jgi:hypothetical protein